MLKPEVAGTTAKLFVQALKQNWLIFATAALSILFFSKKLLLPAGVSALYILFLTQLNRIFSFYFVLLFPFLAVMGGYGIARAAKLQKNVVYAMFIIAILISASYTAYRMHTFDFVDFQSAKPMAEFVKDNSAVSGEIFGDMTATPLVALFSGRRIAFDMVDTNDMLFQSGLVNLTATAERIAKEKIKFVISNPGMGIGALPEFSSFLERKCLLANAFQDKYWGGFLVYDCSQQ